jgi:GT2 family glycosyltransferase
MLSIIILNYNTFLSTSNCIQSIIDFTEGIEYEIIIVDNASSDCEPDNFIKKFPEIKLIKNSENLGFSKGINSALPFTNGEIILLLNSDTLLLNNAIEPCIKHLNNNEHTGVITTRLIDIDDQVQNNCQRFPSAWLMIYEKLRLHKLLKPSRQGEKMLGPYFSYNENIECDWVWGTFFMFPKKILRIFSENKLPETFWMYGEDLEWCWLIKKEGYKVVFSSEGKVLHFGGGKSHSKTSIKMIDKNFREFYRIYYGKFQAKIIITTFKILNLFR